MLDKRMLAGQGQDKSREASITINTIDKTGPTNIKVSCISGGEVYDATKPGNITKDDIKITYSASDDGIGVDYFDGVGNVRVVASDNGTRFTSS